MQLTDPDHILALGYAGSRLRPRAAAIFALDEALGQVLQQAKEAGLAQIRLAWWRERLSEGTGAHPVLVALRDAGVDTKPLAAMPEGWEILLNDFPLSDVMLSEFAASRGGAKFAALADPPHGDIRQLGEGWALANFAWRCSDVETAQRARSLAVERLDLKLIRALPRSLTSPGILAQLALRDLSGASRAGGIRRIGRAFLFAALRR